LVVVFKVLIVSSGNSYTRLTFSISVSFALLNSAVAPVAEALTIVVVLADVPVAIEPINLVCVLPSVSVNAIWSPTFNSLVKFVPEPIIEVEPEAIVTEPVNVVIDISSGSTAVAVRTVSAVNVGEPACEICFTCEIS